MPGKKSGKQPPLGQIGMPAVVVATYPRSGTTWMIKSLSTLYTPAQEAEINSSLFTDSRTNLRNGHYLAFKEERDSRFLIIKTHMSYDQYVETGIDAQVVYVYRHEADVLLSYFFYHQHWIWGRKPDEARFSDGAFSSFLAKHLPKRNQHVHSWVLNRDILGSGAVFFVKYEAMKTEYEATISNMAAFIDHRPTTTVDHCRDIACTCQKFDKTNASFYRKGICGGWRNHFSREHGDMMNDIAGETLSRLGYSLCN